jgi:hypothetical protein
LSSRNIESQEEEKEEEEKERKFTSFSFGNSAKAGKTHGRIRTTRYNDGVCNRISFFYMCTLGLWSKAHPAATGASTSSMASSTTNILASSLFSQQYIADLLYTEIQ